MLSKAIRPTITGENGLNVCAGENRQAAQRRRVVAEPKNRGGNETRMRQVLLKDSGALVARMPCPAVEPGTVLVRVHYSLISVGTEIASLRPVWVAFAGATPGERILSCFSL